MDTAEKKPKILKLKSQETKPEPKFKTMEDLNDRVLDLGEVERKKQETAKEISDTLQYFVDQKNKKATRYLENFRSWMKEKYEHRIWKKYFGKQSKKDVLSNMHNDKEIYGKWILYDKEISIFDLLLRKNFKKEVYEMLKRVFNKEITVHGRNDIDKEAGTLLLKLAKFFKNTKGENVEYNKETVAHGERGKKGFQYDSGGTRDGLDVVNVEKTHQTGPHKGETYKSLFNALAIADEHDKINGAKNIIKPTSSTHIIFNLLNQLGAINPTYSNQIRRFVDFVDKADSQHYQFAGADKEVSHKTVFGLHRKIPIKSIYEYFEDPGHTGFEVLNEKEIEKLNIRDNDQEEQNERKEKEGYALMNKGRFAKFNNESFLFALGKEFSGGQQISAAIGSYGLFQIFESGDLYMYSPTLLPKKICGLSTSEHFLHIKKVGLRDLEKILDVFEFGIDAEIGLKEKFLKYRKEQIDAEQKEINEKMQAEADLKKNKNALLSNTEKITDFKIRETGKNEKTYNGMINKIDNRIAYVTLNKKETIRGRIKVEDKKELKKYIVGSFIKVKVDQIPEEEGKLLTLSLVSTE